MDLIQFLVPHIRKHPKLVDFLKKTSHAVSPETVAVLDFPVFSKPRWRDENPHQKLYAIINKNRALYKTTLTTFLSLSEYFAAIPEHPPINAASKEPYWINGAIPALDGIALYGFIVTHKPKIFMEIGSGSTTKFARQAILDHKLDTKIIIIDPFHHPTMSEICDEIIARPVEDIDLRIFDRLDTNDILFIDNSHRIFMNSDATTLLIDVIPRLKPGVLVEMHDIALPYDYPPEWMYRYYSEQYVLAAYLLAQGNMFDIILPNVFISRDAELKNAVAELWERKEMRNVEPHGCSFWMRIH